MALIGLRINGRDAACLDPLDRGFQYGDGVFSTLPVREGIPVLLERHLDRIERDARRLGIPVPPRDLVGEEIANLLRGTRRGILKIHVTRGCGGRGYRPPSPARPTRVLALHPPADYPETFARDGIEVRYCHIRLGHNPRLAGVKHMNRLEQVLARAEWDDAAIAEGLMLDGDGYVVEGTMSNLFVVRGGRLCTPRLDRCGVEGVMRAEVTRAAVELGWPLEEGRLTPEVIATADEIFVTNSVIGLWPVRRIEGREYTIGRAGRDIGEWLRNIQKRPAAGVETSPWARPA